MTTRTIAKFYKLVTTAPLGDGHSVLLDGKPVKTPGGKTLVVPTAALASAIAQEWDAQGERVDLARMPLTNLAHGAVEGIPRNRGKVIEHILGYARSDLVCYRADSPPELTREQARNWEPLLDWLAERHGCRLQAGEGIAYVDQPQGALLGLERIVCALDDFQLAGLDRIAALTASFVIAYAVLDGRLAARDAFAASQIDELFQAEKWGRDEAAEARRGHIAAELEAADRFLKLSATPEA